MSSTVMKNSCLAVSEVNSSLSPKTPAKSKKRFAGTSNSSEGPGSPGSPGSCPTNRFGFPTPYSSLSVKEFLGHLEAEEMAESSTLHGNSISSMPDTMYSCPENHCSPRAAFPGQAYSIPVVRPISQQAQKPKSRSSSRPISQQQLARPSSQQHLTRPSSQPALNVNLGRSGSAPGTLAKMAGGRQGSSPTKSTSPNKHSAFTNFMESANRANGTSRKKDPTGSVSGSLPVVSPQDKGKTGSLRSAMGAFDSPASN